MQDTQIDGSSNLETYLFFHTTWMCYFPMIVKMQCLLFQMSITDKDILRYLWLKQKWQNCRDAQMHLQNGMGWGDFTIFKI